MTAPLETVARYDRDLGANLTRMFENALDWEHLPHVHAGAFRSIDLIEERESGWRADVVTTQGESLVIDLELDRKAGCWTTDSFAGSDLVGRIVTHATARGADGCHVAVEFQVPEADTAKREALEAFYPALYAMLYDEDEAMMVARQEAVERGPGALAERREAVLGGGETVAIARYCPHLGLPLDAEPDGDGIVTCPWHGYRFDARTGRCVSGQSCNWTA